MVTICSVLAVVLTGCGSKPGPIASTSEVDKTPEQLVENNKSIQDSDISLLQLEAPANGSPVAVIETSFGTIELVLYPEQAPKAVENFTALAKAGYYNGLKFHRILENYLIQSGDPTGTGTGGESSFKNAETGEAMGFAKETSLNLWNFRGALGMASDENGLNGSQFYIIQSKQISEEVVGQMQSAAFPERVQTAYQEHGGAPWLDSKYTVFGQVITGLDVVDAIAASAAQSQSSQDASSSALEPVITNVTMKTYSAG